MDTIPNVKVLSMSVKGKDDDEMGFQYRLESGATDINHYGLRIAQRLELPRNLIDISKDFCQQVTI